MLYVSHTLKLDLYRRTRLPSDECIKIGLALTTALEHLHGHGLVHRDIKPSNIIFVNGTPKLADIGLVASMDKTMSFVGPSGILPPEGPARRRPIFPRSAKCFTKAELPPAGLAALWAVNDIHGRRKRCARSVDHPTCESANRDDTPRFRVLGVFRGLKFSCSH